MYHHIRSGICLFILLISHISLASQQTQPDDFILISSTILQPVYGPLAEQIVDDFDLADMKGIGIDLGSGPGDLIIELCKRTRYLHWVNADINPGYFPEFIRKAKEAAFENRVSAMYADAAKLPFHDDFADILVSRGSFHLWGNQTDAFGEIYRILKPGGTAFVGRGFSRNLPIETALKIRTKQNKRGSGLKYDVRDTAAKLESIMKSLAISDYHLHLPNPPGGENINYGVWLEFHKPLLK
jgi:SAM-dependent methyltransferase